MSSYYQNIVLFGNKYAKEKAYWDNTLSGEFEIGGFIPDKRGIEAGQYKKGEYVFTIPLALVNKLYEVSRGSNYGIYALLLSAVNYTICRYSGNTDIVVGIPPLLEKGKIETVNPLLPFRCRLEPNISIKEYLKNTGKAISDAVRNQSIPFKKGAGGKNGIHYKAAVVLKNIHTAEFIDEALLEMLVVYEAEDAGITGRIIYNELLFNRSTIQCISEFMLKFLQLAVVSPEAYIVDIDLLTEAEKQYQIYELNNTDAEYPKDKTIHQLFEEQVKRTPDNIAIVFKDRQMTYKELNTKADRLASTLRKKGVGKDNIVAIMAERSLEMIIGIIAILKAGGAYLPIEPEYPRERIMFMLSDSGARLLLTQKHLCTDLPFAGDIVLVDEEASYETEGCCQETFGSPRDLAYVIYTSGTTGRPKGAMIEHRNVVRLMFNDKMQFDFNEKDVWTMFHSYCFDFSVWEMYGALLYGGKLIVIPGLTAKDTSEYYRVLKREKVTILNQTPSAFYRLIEVDMERKEKELSIRKVIFGGEALKPVMLKAFRRKYPDTKLINMYGITETTVHVTYKEVTDEDIEYNISNIGRPIPTLTAYIMDRSLKLLPAGAAGELCVGGDGVGRGYLNRKELTEEKFVYNPYKAGERLYRSGDLVRRLPSGDMEYLGRIDNQVKIRGYRIELEEIENQLLQHENINNAVAVVREDKDGNQNICAYVVGNGDLTVITLRKFLSERLPEYMLPSFFIQLESIPLTVNGKVDRKALPEPDGSILMGTKYEAPRNILEEGLVEIWKEVLGVENLGITDNFFALGGDSIKALRLVSVINNRYKKSLGIRNIYENTSIKELSACMDESRIGIDTEQAAKEVENFKRSILENKDQAANLPEDYEDFYPMSDIEQGMVFYYLRDSKDAVYHDQLTYAIKGKNIDIKAMEKAIALMTQKHQILRTSFDTSNFSQMIQVVHKTHSPDIRIVHLEGMREKEKDSCIKEYLAKDKKELFDMTRPLWRVYLFVKDHDILIFALICHHAILDGWSVASYVTELANTYNRIKNAGEKELKMEPLEHSYKDFVIEQIAVKSRREIAEYWERELLDHKRLKLGFRADTAPSGRMGQIQYELDKALRIKVKELSDRCKTSVKNIYLIAYSYMLNMLSYENDIVVGLVEHNRPICKDSDKILGCFLNTVPLRMKFEKGMTWMELIDWIISKTTELKLYGKLSLYEILKIIGKGDAYENPIFDTLFNYVDFHILNDIDADIEEDTMSAVDELTYAKTNTLLDFTLYNSNDRVVADVGYDNGIFSHDDAMRLVDYFVRILGLVVENPERVIDKADVLSEDEKKMYAAYNETYAEYAGNKLLNELFEEQVKRTPNNIAVIFRDNQFTYQELDERSNQIAHYLIGQGVVKNDFVAVSAKRDIFTIANILGILKAGAAYIPIDPDYPEEGRAYISSDSQYKIMLESDCYMKKDMSKYPVEKPEVAALSRENAYVIYTSGSTGRPKGVIITHKAAVNTILDINKRIAVDEKDRILGISSMCFDLSVYDIFGALSTGAALVMIPDQRDIKNISKALTEYGITIWNSVPAIMDLCVEHINGRYCENNTLRMIMLSGDWIPLKLPEKLWRKFPKASIISLGGATEASIWSCYYPVSAVEKGWKSIPYGWPLSNQRLYVLDKSMQMCPVSVKGEIYIGGDGLAKGYLNDGDKTAKAFIRHEKLGNLYRTGDFGVFHKEGYIEFCGRLDQQVKIRGYRIELGEIEQKLLRHKDIKEAILTVKEDSSKNKYLCAYITGDKELTTNELRTFLSKELPDYMIPAHFVRLEKIPLTPNGKIDRNALPEPLGNVNIGSIYEAPRDEIEMLLTDIWKDILKVNNIGINDSFFELGGYSLKATSFISKIGKLLNMEIPLEKIYLYNTIKEFAEYIRTEMNDAAKRDHNNIVLIKKGSDYKKNVFMVHNGSGEFDVFRELCGYLDSRVNYWGIRADRFEINDIGTYSIEQIAKGYIEQIKSIQKTGPYYIIGWCLGGTIAFEMSRALEEEEEEIGMLYMINSEAPHYSLKYINVGMQSHPEKSVTIGIEEYYSRVLQFLRKESMDSNLIKEVIDPYILNAIPEQARNSREDMLYYVNTLRILDCARAHYIPKEKIRSRIRFIKAAKTPASNYEMWNLYSSKPLSVISIDTEHYMLHQKPDMLELAGILDNYMKQDFELQGGKAGQKENRIADDIGRAFVERTKLKYLGDSDQDKGLPQPELELGYEKGAVIIDLPAVTDVRVKGIDLRRAIESRRSTRKYSDTALKIDELSYLLWCTQGVKQIFPHNATLRTVPSAGARHAFETYLIVNSVTGIKPGIYRYLALEHKLLQISLEDGLPEKLASYCMDQEFVSKSAVTFIWGAAAYRMKWRYGERGYRYLYLDAGHVCQNLYLAAEDIESGVCAISAFDDDKINSMLGMDGVDQFVVYIAALGKKV